MASDLSLLKSGVTSTLDLSATAAEDTANAAAQAATAAGNTIEAGSYGSAVAAANQSAGLETIAGQIRDVQEQRKISATLGTQRAGVAASGFAAGSETSMALVRSSLQAGYLSTQLNRVQTGINESGYLEQAAASGSEQAAANAAATSATTLGSSFTNAGAIATANAASETDAIQKMLLQDYNVNGPLTPQQAATQNVVTATLQSPLNGAVTLPKSAVPALAVPGAAGNQPNVASGFVAGPPMPGIPLSSVGSATLVPRPVATSLSQIPQQPSQARL